MLAILLVLKIPQRWGTQDREAVIVPNFAEAFHVQKALV